MAWLGYFCFEMQLQKEWGKLIKHQYTIWKTADSDKLTMEFNFIIIIVFFN